jgi:mannosyltransferase
VSSVPLVAEAVVEPVTRSRSGNNLVLAHQPGERTVAGAPAPTYDEIVRAEHTSRVLHARASALTVAAVAGLTLLAAVFRFATLDGQSFWSDEAITVLLTRMDIGEMLRTVGDTESTPPVYYVLAWAWANVAGDGETGLRSLSALAGTATVPVTYVAGSWLVGRRAGIVAAALVAVSPTLVWYAQEARSYALAVLLCGISFAAMVRALDRPRGWTLAAWAAASVLAVGTHYFAAFVVGAEALWLLAAWRLRAVWIAVAAAAVGGLAFLPLALEQRGNGFAEFISDAGDSLGGRIVVAGKQLLIGAAPITADRAVAAAIVLPVIAAVVLLLREGTRRDRRGALVGATVGGAPVIVPIALALVGLDYLNTRNVQVGVVPLVVAASAGLALALSGRWSVLVPAGLIAGLMAVTILVAADPAYHRPDWRGLAQALGPPDAERAIVVAPDHQGWFARVPLQVYLPRASAVDDGLVATEPQFAALSRRTQDHAAPSRISVREVVLAGVGWTVPALPRPLPSQLRLVEERSGAGFRYRRYRSSGPVSVATASLLADPAAILVEAPG